ncbi:MAG: hypothetical protein ACTHQ3_04700 [Motilibacteraceae bacterium]
MSTAHPTSTAHPIPHVPREYSAVTKTSHGAGKAGSSAPLVPAWLAAHPECPPALAEAAAALDAANAKGRDLFEQIRSAREAVADHDADVRRQVRRGLDPGDDVDVERAALARAVEVAEGALRAHVDATHRLALDVEGLHRIVHRDEVARLAARITLEQHERLKAALAEVSDALSAREAAYSAAGSPGIGAPFSSGAKVRPLHWRHDVSLPGGGLVADSTTLAHLRKIVEGFPVPALVALVDGEAGQ